MQTGEGEQCDGDPDEPCDAHSSDLLGGSVHCGPNCLWDRSECELAPLALSELGTSSKDVEYRDTLDESHSDIAYTLFQRPEPLTWLAVIRDKSTSDVLAVYKLEFDDDGSLALVNGLRPLDAGGSDPNPKIVLGADEDPAGVVTAYGDADLSDVDGGGQIAHTGSFSNGAPPLVLDVRFENLRAENASDAWGDPVTGYWMLLVHTRHGQVQNGPYAGEEIPTGGPCAYQTDSANGYSWCELGWNDETQRYETTQEAQIQLHEAFLDEFAAGMSFADFKAALRDSEGGASHPYLESEWERMAAAMSATYGLTLAVPTVVEAEFDEAGCPDPVFEPSSLVVSEPQRIILALDKSGSMGAPVTWGGFDGDVTRLDFAKASGQMFLHRQLTRSSLPEIGLVWYDAPQTVGASGVYPLADGHPRLLQSTSVAPDGATDEEVEAAVQASTTVGVPDLTRFMRIGTTPAEENPTAGGMTAIGDVLDFSGAILSDPSPNTQAIVLLSDGEETALPVGLTENDPLVIAEQLRSSGVQVYSLALGFETSGIMVSQIADQTFAPHWTVRDPRELPGAFFEAYARQRGEALVRSARTEVEIVGTGGEFPNYYMRQPIPVEEGAERLVVLLSKNRGDLYWPLGYELRDPSGEVAAPQISYGPYYRLLSVDSPPGGEWSLSWMQDYGEGAEPASLVAAHVENPSPDCLAGFKARVVAEGERIELGVTPEYGEYGIAGGVTITATVRRPDYSTVQLEVPFDALRERYRVELPPEELRGRGSYEAVVRCVVVEGADLVGGESFGRHLPPPTVNVPAFERETTANFYYDTTELPPLPGPGTPFADDCDGDGILNDDEPEGDADQDGAPNICDGDADGDDVPDGLDPDPYVPHQGCMKFPPSVGCCSSLADCGGGGFALYAEGQLRIADRTEVVDADGHPAMVANAGGLETNVGVDNYLGHVYSAADVVLRENAFIDGSIWTEGTIEEQNGVTVTGRRWTETTLTFPPLGAFGYQFLGGTLDPVQLEPGAVASLTPGAYAAADIKEGAVLGLTSGMYEFDSLMLHPGAHLDADTSGGPVTIYARHGLVVRGMLPGSADPGLLLFASLGTEDVIIEAPFKGTVVAPNAKAIVTGGTHQGAFFARNLQVNPDAEIEYRPFQQVWPHTDLGPCGNGVLDAAETDTDCGGPDCAPCSVGQSCVLGTDCATGSCTGGICDGAATLTATLVLSSNWNLGYCAEVTVTNSGVSPTAAWRVVVDLAESSPTTWWCGDFQVSGSELVVDSVDYNRTIWPGSSTSFGFCADKEGTSWTPTVVGAMGM